ncbi:MAG: RNA-binding S4 domain-containing protein [Bacteroidetes bacterium]|nr:RNA-binding S4 domain-containing protein [Bacteroidota bacterium]
MQEIAIHTEYIQLNQLIKLAGWVENGSEANACIEEGLVQVNGQTELRKRNKIYPGMQVSIESEDLALTVLAELK